MSYLNASDVTVSDSNQNFCYNFLTCICAPLFKKVSATHASDNVLEEPSVRFSVGLLRTKFQITNVPFSSVWQFGRGKYNVATAAEDL